VISTFLDTFYAIFCHLILVKLDMKWLIGLFLNKKKIRSDKDMIVQKILLKKYLLR